MNPPISKNAVRGAKKCLKTALCSLVAGVK